MIAGMATGIAYTIVPGHSSTDAPLSSPLPVADGSAVVILNDHPQVLLIIDDEERLGEVAALLSASGMTVACLSDPYGTNRVARPGHMFAAILLDVLLPTRDLYRLCRQLRSSGSVPLIIASWEDRTALEAGPHDQIFPHSSSADELADKVLAVVAINPGSPRITD